MLARNRESIERRQACRPGCGLDVQFRADTADEQRPVARGWKHPAQKEQIAGLDRFRVRPERRWWRWQRDVEVLHPLLGADPGADWRHRASRSGLKPARTSS